MARHPDSGGEHVTAPGECAPWVFLPPWSDADLDLCRRFALARADAARADQWTLRRCADGALELHTPAARPPLAVALDLRRGDLARRLRSARADQPLPRALGLHRRPTPPAVVDATAGLGRDALLLAQLGCRVVACERLAALAAMVGDAAARAGLAERVAVHCVDACQWLAALDDGARPDVVCLDPMFPAAGQAQVRKEMQVCRLLAGAPESPAVLVHRAFAAARERV